MSEKYKILEEGAYFKVWIGGRLFCRSLTKPEAEKVVAALTLYDAVQAGELDVRPRLADVSREELRKFLQELFALDNSMWREDVDALLARYAVPAAPPIDAEKLVGLFHDVLYAKPASCWTRWNDVPSGDRRIEITAMRQALDELGVSEPEAVPAAPPIDAEKLTIRYRVILGGIAGGQIVLANVREATYMQQFDAMRQTLTEFGIPVVEPPKPLKFGGMSVAIGPDSVVVGCYVGTLDQLKAVVAAAEAQKKAKAVK